MEFRLQLLGVAAPATVLLLGGCVATPVTQAPRYERAAPPPVVRVYEEQDDYDYYPAYEVYYSRSRHEYVYRDGARWVRRPEPQGISLSLMLASASVRVDFHDAPERHHENVVRLYPRAWRAEPAPAPQVIVVVQDDYQYYPAFEIYYSRTRKDYVYQENGAWVRRAQPRGVPLQVIHVAPFVMVDFHDSPEHHHASMVRTYPKNWRPEPKAQHDNGNRHDNRKSERDDDRRDDERRN
jgi:hypothetical protein